MRLTVSIELFPWRSQLGECREKRPGRGKDDVPRAPERSHADTKIKSKPFFSSTREARVLPTADSDGCGPARNERWAPVTNGESIADGRDPSGDR